MHTSTKNTSIYTKFGRNRPIVSIDGYDETVHDGLACHVAPAWAPRAFWIFYIYIIFILIYFKSKLNQKNQGKSQKTVKIISFKIQLQINPNFFHWIWNLIIYHSKNSKYLNNKRFNLYFKNTFISLRF